MAINIASYEFDNLLTELDSRFRIKKKYEAECGEAYQKHPLHSSEYIDALIRKNTSASFYSGMVYAINWLISDGFTDNLRLNVNDNGEHHVKDFTEEWEDIV